MPNKISPHDKLFRETMARPEVARDFLQQYLPDNIKSVINLDSLQLTGEKFVDERLIGHLVDLLYTVDFGDNKGYIYILFEHLSNEDKMIAFRLWKYVVNIMEYHITKVDPQGALPIVYPIVVYSGAGKYNCARSIFDLFGDKKQLAEDVLLKPYELVDLQNIPNEQLRQQIWFGLMAQLFRRQAKNGIMLIEIISPFLSIVDKKGDIKFINTVVRYILDVYEVADKEKFFEKLTSNVSKKSGGKIMTIADSLRQEGFEKGKFKGVLEGKLEGKLEAMEEVALSMLLENEPIEKIMKITHLPKSKIKKLRTIQ